MTHLDQDKYFQKHPGKAKVDDSLKQEILQNVEANDISCAAAEEIARRKGIAQNNIGITIDILNIKIIECQLGLFGHSPHKKIVQPVKEIAPVLKKNILAALKNGCLPCSIAWEIAEKFNIPRMKVSAACEAMQIKIKPCQLGAF
ncbi:MAG: hypothetical protein ABSC54_00165 [Smithellaceae bacterium]|jgi:hypothetical protein